MDELVEGAVSGCLTACGDTLGIIMLVYFIFAAVLYFVFDLGLLVSGIGSAILTIGALIGYSYLDSSQYGSRKPRREKSRRKRK